MLSESLCFTSPLSTPTPINLRAYRCTKKLTGLNQSRPAIVCAAVRQYAQMATLYDLLELSPDVGISDIKQAYRQMARKYHPDVCPPHQTEESTRRFIEIQEAYETLSDPRSRAVYDHAVAMGCSSRMPWMTNEMENQPSDWRSQWESQLFELRHRSAMKARKTDSWSARVRRQQGRSDA